VTLFSEENFKKSGYFITNGSFSIEIRPKLYLLVDVKYGIE
jgi:hypothetical protein